MRDQVYVKFAAALQKRQAVKKAEDRSAFVHVKFAEALQRRQLEKKAAGGRAGAIVKALRSLYMKASPEITLRGKFDPRRLFSTTKRTVESVTNTRPFTAEELTRAGQNAGKAYGGGAYGGSGSVKHYADIENTGGVKETTRLSPLKILAALGLGSGATATAVAAKNKPAVQTPAVSPKPETGDDLWKRILSNHKMQAALAGVGLLTAGGIAGGYMLSDDNKKKEKKRV